MEFREGVRCVADEVMPFTPGNPAATDPLTRRPEDAPGIPDHPGATERMVSPGSRGRLVLRVAGTSSLIGRNSPDRDVRNVEAGAAVPFLVAIRVNGTGFIQSGQIGGTPTGIDIDPVPVSPGLPCTTRFSRVRIADPGAAAGATAGAGIAAAGAISSGVPVPTPATTVPVPAPGLPMGGLVVLASLRRRRG